MKFHNLVQKYDWQTVSTTLFQLYPKQEANLAGYERVFSNLKTLTPEAIDMTIFLENVHDEEFEMEDYVDVSAKENSMDFNNPENSYGIELTPWKNWLDMNIDENSLSIYSEIEIVAHCLYEMTFYGFDEDTIQQTMDSWGTEETFRIDDINAFWESLGDDEE